MLTEQHGQRIAVIENEFGEIGIDHGLVINADEEIFEMNNGCICCTVRGDLIRILGNLLRAVKALEDAVVPYAVAGGNAVAAWVSRVDEAAVRNTRDVDILLRRADLELARQALAGAGFTYRRVASLGQPGGRDLFLDGAEASARDAVHVVFASEKVREDSPEPSPEVTELEPGDQFRLVTLEGLVRMKLVAFCDKDCTHLRDLIDVGLVYAPWLQRLPPVLRDRLQLLLQTPEG